MVVWLTGPRCHWVVLGSFIPRPYSGILISLLLGLRILLTMTLGSRNHFILESPFTTDDLLLRRKILQILLDVSRDHVPTASQFLTTDKSWWITTYTCRTYILLSYSFVPSDISLSDISRIPRTYRLAVPFHLNILWIIPHIPRDPFIPSCSCVSRNSSYSYPISRRSSAA